MRAISGNISIFAFGIVNQVTNNYGREDIYWTTWYEDSKTFKMTKRQNDK